MDLEAPVDAWYVWIGVALVAAGLFVVVTSLPSDPPPDANGAANTIDEVASNPYPSHASYEYDATGARIGLQEISLRNDAGTNRAIVRYGPITPLEAIDGAANRSAVTRILDGESPSEVVETMAAIENEGRLRAAAATARKSVESRGATWRPAGETLRVRKVFLDEEPVVLVDA